MGYAMGQKPMLTDKQAKALKPSDKPVWRIAQSTTAVRYTKPRAIGM